MNHIAQSFHQSGGRIVGLISQYVCGHETLHVKDDLRADEYLIYHLIFMLKNFSLPEFFLARDIRVSENRNLGLDRLIEKHRS